MRTKFVGEFDGYEVVCTEFAQKKARSPDRRVKFPVTVEYYDQRAKIYTPAKGFPFYRIAFKVAGKRRMLTFGTYSEAKKAAEDKVRELHKGQQSSALTATQTRDALAAFERLQEFFQATGRRVSLLSGISEYCEAATKLQKRTFSECVDGYMRIHLDAGQFAAKINLGSDFPFSRVFWLVCQPFELTLKPSDITRSKISGC